MISDARLRELLVECADRKKRYQHYAPVTSLGTFVKMVEELIRWRALTTKRNASDDSGA